MVVHFFSAIGEAYAGPLSPTRASDEDALVAALVVFARNAIGGPASGGGPATGRRCPTRPSAPPPKASAVQEPIRC